MNRIRLDLIGEVSRIRGMMNVDEEDVNHIYQPTGNSCGPTCIKMVGDFIKGDVGSIDDICTACGTDWIVGTPPDRMKLGLNELGINYIEHQSELEPYQSIKNVIDKGNVAIVRTITRGVPHWIVITGYENDIFLVNDPWLGPIRYDEDQLEDVWSVRDFFFFEIITGRQQLISNVSIRLITNEDLPIIYNNLAEVFDKTRMTNEQIWVEIRNYSPNLSVVAEVNEEVAGFYFLSEHQIPPGGNDYETLKDLYGVEGMGLGVFKKYKNMGVGKKLIQYSQNIPGVEYIWGYQLKSLKNIDDWVKKRNIYMNMKGLYVTYQILNKKGM